MDSLNARSHSTRRRGESITSRVLVTCGLPLCLVSQLNITASWDNASLPERKAIATMKTSPDGGLMDLKVDAGEKHPKYPTSVSNSHNDCFDFNAAAHTCDFSCHDGKPCKKTSADSVTSSPPPPPPPGAGCGCSQINFFAGVAAATYAGACPGKAGTTLWTLGEPASDDDGHLSLELTYCFRGNDPVYLLYRSKKAAGVDHPLQRALNQVAASADDDSADDDDLPPPAQALYEVLHYSTAPIPASTFDPPSYCMCSQ